MKKTILTFALALMLLFSVSLAVSAQTNSADDAVTITQVDGLSAPDPADAPDVQSEAPAQPVAGEPTTEDIPDISAPQNGNTPYFIGAGIAVLVFIGVALYCKTNGNKTL